MYTEYTVQILGYNTAGDGPRSRPVTARTLTVSGGMGGGGEGTDGQARRGEGRTGVHVRGEGEDGVRM